MERNKELREKIREIVRLYKEGKIDEIEMKKRIIDLVGSAEVNVKANSTNAFNFKGEGKFKGKGMMSVEDKKMVLKTMEEFEKNKEKILKEIKNKREELRNKVKEVKKKAIEELKQKKKLDEKTKKEIIDLIKEKIKIRLNLLELKITNAMEFNSSNEDEELVNLIKQLDENSSNNNMDELVQLFNEVESLKAQVDQVDNVRGLKEVVKQYLLLKYKVNLEIKAEGSAKVE